MSACSGLKSKLVNKVTSWSNHLAEGSSFWIQKAINQKGCCKASRRPGRRGLRSPSWIRSPANEGRSEPQRWDDQPASEGALRPEGSAALEDRTKVAEQVQPAESEPDWGVRAWDKQHNHNDEQREHDSKKGINGGQPARKGQHTLRGRARGG